MNPLRVLLIFTILNRGGAETMVMNYYRRLDRSKLQFDFLVHRETPGVYEEEIKELGGRIFRLPPLSLGHLPAYRRSVSRFFDEHPEYRMIHGHCSELGYWIYREASRRGIPFIAAHAHSSPLGWDRNTVFRFFLKHLMRPCLTHHFACNEASSRWLFGKKGAAQAVMVRNAIDASAFSYNEEIRTRIRKRQGWERKLVVGHIGSFCWYKNHVFLFEVFRELILQCTDSVLALIGSGGEQEETVTRMAVSPEWQERVELLGGRDDVNLLLQGVDVFLFPSFFEGLSLALVEAQAAGLPVLVSDRVLTDGVVVPEAVHFLSLNATPAEWASRLKNLALEYERRDTSQDIRRAGLDVEENAAKLQELYLREGGRLE